MQVFNINFNLSLFYSFSHRANQIKFYIQAKQLYSQNIHEHCHYSWDISTHLKNQKRIDKNQPLYSVPPPVLNLSARYIIYPPPPNTSDSVLVTLKDLEHLRVGEFLNDTIIDFYLKYLMLDTVPRCQMTKKFYCYSSFFYKKLLSTDRDKALLWTRNVPIFDMDYLFLPININLHWSLVVIVSPGLLSQNLSGHMGCRIEYFDSLGKKRGPNWRR
jgi:hypothetical protein